MIEKENDPLGKLEYMEQYAKYCSEYGRSSSAIKIYQQIIDKFLFAPDRRRKAMVELNKCFTSPMRVNG